MDYHVRHIRQDGWPLPEDALCEAISVSEDAADELPRSAVYNDPLCCTALEGFGTLARDGADEAVWLTAKDLCHAR